MQFIKDGHHIPEELLHDHEEGKVVFFCGAGISMGAGLPDFKGLVEILYQKYGYTKSDIKNKLRKSPEYKEGRLDILLKKLEQKIQGGRERIIKHCVDILEYKPNPTTIHDSILKLSRSNKDHPLHLVTTNFDHYFEETTKHIGEPITQYITPALPVPKDRRWDGLVYLHGRLPEKNISEPDNLVLTSTDFGRTYLTEGNTLRFVLELFRNYTVCFIGYSLDDILLRYTVDALATEKETSKENFSSRSIYTLSGYRRGKEQETREKWEEKGVIPVLYKIGYNKSHKHLQKYLEKWATQYRSGTGGKKYIITESTGTRPLSTDEYNINRVLWALADKSGLPAKHFAELDPAPPLEWLDEFSKEKYATKDLRRFSVTPCQENKSKEIGFSLTHRPASYHKSPWMSLASNDHTDTEWDVIMFHIARWLVRHLNDPSLIAQLAKQGNHLHVELKRLIANKLDKLSSNKNISQENEATNHKEKISPEMETLWRLFLAEKIRAPDPDDRLHPCLYSWQKRFKRHGLTTTLRLELRELLSPIVEVYYREPLSVDGKILSEAHLVKNIRLASKHTFDAITKELQEEYWQEALPFLFEDFQQLLKDALDLIHDIHEKQEHTLRSIEKHEQNHIQYNVHDWTNLIELLRSSWLTIYKKDRERATQIAQNWFAIPYITFKRLALYAASQDEVIPSDQWVEWLVTTESSDMLQEEAQTCVCAKRETMRLLVLQGKHLDKNAQEKLEKTILQNLLSDKEKQEKGYDEYHTWLRLAKLNASGLRLNDTAQKTLDSLSQKHPKWQFSKDNREEFPSWIEVTSVSPTGEYGQAPSERKDLVKWIRQQTEPPELTLDSHFKDDGWKEICHQKPYRSLLALYELTREGKWSKEYWWRALMTWNSLNTEKIKPLWHRGARIIKDAPDDIMKDPDIRHVMASWLHKVAQSSNQHFDILIGMCRRIIDQTPKDEKTKKTNNPANQAINHAIGMVTQALFEVYYKRDKPRVGDEIPTDIKEIFTQLCNTEIPVFRHGRVILAHHAINLFHLDKDWTLKNLLPLFDWQKLTKEETIAVWDGFLWTSRIELSFYRQIKQQFLETASHYEALSDDNYAGGKKLYPKLLTYTALTLLDGYKMTDFRRPLEQLPLEARIIVANTLSNIFDSIDDDKKVNYWEKHFKPFWENAWPQEKTELNGLANPLAQLCINTKDKFPETFKMVSSWLEQIEHGTYIIQKLHRSNLCEKYPESSLDFLDKIQEEEPEYLDEYLCLCLCLEQISTKNSALKTDSRYIKLDVLCQKHKRPT